MKNVSKLSCQKNPKNPRACLRGGNSERAAPRRKVTMFWERRSLRAEEKAWSMLEVHGPPNGCFLEVFGYIKASTKQPFGGAGSWMFSF